MNMLIHGVPPISDMDFDTCYPAKLKLCPFASKSAYLRTFLCLFSLFLFVAISLFYNLTFLGQVLFSIQNLKSNICIFGLETACVVILMFPTLFVDVRIWFAVLAVLYILIYPAFRSLLIQFAIFPYIKKTMIEPYYEAHPEADKRAMRTLNIETEEDAEESVFEDR